VSTELSKFLSYVLRHAPESIGVVLDAQGWTGVDELIAKATASGRRIDRPGLERVVLESDKKRFTLSDDGQRIRAAQGHSVEVSLGKPATVPPTILYHGTATRFLASIRDTGLRPGSRQQVHLSKDEGTALKVGERHGKPVVLKVAAGQMSADGHKFYVADNGVWLTDHVPAQYLSSDDSALSGVGA
jgi:putative RNA 2'-phosphotransferase